MPNAKPLTKIAIGFAAAVLVGAAKEVSDYRHPGTHDCSLKDFAATAAGGALGSVSVGWVIHF